MMHGHTNLKYGGRVQKSLWGFWIKTDNLHSWGTWLCMVYIFLHFQLTRFASSEGRMVVNDEWPSTSNRVVVICTNSLSVTFWSELGIQWMGNRIWCDFDRASSLICGNKMPTRCNRGFYCRSYCLLNMNIKIADIQSEIQSLERRDTKQEHEPGSTIFYVTYLLCQKVFNFGPLCVVQLVITNVSLRYNLWYVV